MQAMTDLGAIATALYAGATNNSGAPLLITAAGTGDDTAVTGATIDTQGYKSCKFVIAYLAALTDAKSLELAVEYQESDNGSSWDTAVALRANAIVVTSSGGSNESGQLEFNLNFRDGRVQKRYIRVNFTPDLDATGTDTAILMAVAIMGGKDVL